MKYVIQNQKHEYLKYSNRYRSVWTNDQSNYYPKDPIVFRSPEKILNYLRNSYPTIETPHHEKTKLEIIPLQTNDTPNDTDNTTNQILKQIIEKFEEYSTLENTLTNQIRLMNYNFLKTNAKKLKRQNFNYLIYCPLYPYPKRINELIEDLNLITDKYIQYENTFYLKTKEELIATKLIIKDKHRIFELKEIFEILI